MQLLLVSSIVLASAVFMAQGVPYFSFGRCSYTGDPHLIPFPSIWNQTMNMYFCQRPGWDLLLQNRWVTVLVKVGPSPYVILDYIVIFYNANQQIVCLLIGSSGSQTCAIGSSVISIANPSATSWNHWYPSAQFMNIQISSFPWYSGRRYDINIRQTMALIQQSRGLCVKWDCPLERVLGTPPPVAIKVCDTYLASARQRALGRVDDGMARNLITACQNDLLLTFNPKLARTLVAQIIHHSLDQVDGENYRDAVVKAEDNIRAAILEADRMTASILADGETCLEQKRCLESNEE